MKKVRFGVIGIGNMGTSHSEKLDRGIVPEIELTAVCDLKEDRCQWAREHLSSSVQVYQDPEEMMTKAPLDAVIVATPHYDHPRLVMDAFRHGLHAITESPRRLYGCRTRDERSRQEEWKAFWYHVQPAHQSGLRKSQGTPGQWRDGRDQACHMADHELVPFTELL